MPLYMRFKKYNYGTNLFEIHDSNKQALDYFDNVNELSCVHTYTAVASHFKADCTHFNTFTVYLSNKQI